MPFINPLDPIDWKPIYGVPIGGIGSGAIARGFRGEFCRSSILPGVYNFDLNPVDLFIVTIKKRGQAVFQQVLSTNKEAPSHSGVGLKTWSWGFPESQGHYIGLYPRSWTIYELPRFKIILICKQVSPVIPNDYKDTTLPCVTFEWSILSFNKDEDLECTITMTWRGPRHPIRHPTKHEGAAIGHSRKTSEDLENSGFHSQYSKEEVYTGARISSFEVPAAHGKLKGCTLDTRIGNDIHCCYGLAARCTDRVAVSRCPGFNIDSDQSNSSKVNSGFYNVSNQTHYDVKDAPSAKDLWLSLMSSSSALDSANSYVSQSSLSYKRVSTPATNSRSHDHCVPDRLAMAVSASCSLEAMTADDKPTTKKLEFFLCWHTPRVHFRSAEVAYTRRYARWFPELGRTGTKRLLAYTADSWKDWDVKINGWQKPYLNDKSLPDWYKSALFNELYFLTDGGTVWLDPLHPVPLKKSETRPLSPTMHKQGLLSRFLSYFLQPVEKTKGELSPLPSLNSALSDHSYQTLKKDVLPFDLVRSNCEELRLDPAKLTGRHIDCEVPSMLSDQDKLKKLSWQHRLELGREIGLFGYIEGHEYRMYNTYDVHHFAAWSMIALWPKLQWSINYDFGDQCISEDRAMVEYIYQGTKTNRSTFMAVPHDLGDPEDEPWRRSNAYIMFPTDTWKDLPPKLVLNTWRDFKYSKDWLYLIYMLPICYNLIDDYSKYDLNDDGIIENSGFPDQTFDAWKVTGTSAYTGGLWISALYALYDMVNALVEEKTDENAKLMVKSGVAHNGKRWEEVLTELRKKSQLSNASFEEKLWNGLYYDYQDHQSSSSHTIMAAQLVGYCHLALSGAPDNAVFEKSKIKSVLEVIKLHNWLGVEDGRLGAVNGMLPCCSKAEILKCKAPSDFVSKVDIDSVQSEEFWIGINYTIAAIMINEGMQEDAFKMAGSIFSQVYDKWGMQYQTPEAIMMNEKYRSLGYMRPLAIWSMQLAYEKCKNLNLTVSNASHAQI
ncbi:Non-lysosomal glucosylceramidase [Cichlidogyrus casuarinus]|uniref:Non-lysosomal glucosylceramidase n=1 Tax=Cichlidogyrus casuarinus TaxID=1844966 RepID=A0ABD2Q591_9PLAT